MNVAEPRTDFWETHPRTLKACRALLAHCPEGTPWWLICSAIHEAGHVAAALSVAVVPCKARVWLDEQLTGPGGPAGRGEVCWRCYPTFQQRTPRERAIISACGAAAARMCLDSDSAACEVSDSDLKHITGEGLTADDVMPDAYCLVKKHRIAILRLAITLTTERTMTAKDIMHLLASHAEMATLRDAFSGVK